jgi:excisionase family DNA binding protein
MDLILLVVGLILLYRGRWSFAGFETEGKHVKAAGALLMMPATVNVVLAFVLMIIFGNNPDAVFAAANSVSVFMLLLMMGVVGLAYILIADPPGAPQLPSMLGEIQNERRGLRQNSEMQQDTTFSTPSPIPQRPQVRHPLDLGGMSARPQPRATYGTVLTVRDAAQYMNVSEQQIMQWIDEGKVTAARGNNGFAIARSVLDELKDTSRVPA